MEHAGHRGDAIYSAAIWNPYQTPRVITWGLLLISSRRTVLGVGLSWADTCRSHWYCCLGMSLSDSLGHLVLFQTEDMTLCEVICITKYCHDQISSPHYPIENNLSSEVSFCPGCSACCVHSGLRWLGGAGWHQSCTGCTAPAWTPASHAVLRDGL